MNPKFSLVIACLLVSGCGGGGGSGSPSSPTDTATADTTRPVISAPSALSVEAADGSGVASSNSAIQSFLTTASATDNIDGTLTVANDAPAIFLLGATTVTFSAVDAALNNASTTVQITVVSQTQSGNALKGPLYNAKVFLDYDGDTVHDSNEPFTLTDTAGGYSIAEDSLAPASYNVVVVMGDETIDYTTGESFAETGMYLQAPEGGSIASPITTLFSHSQSIAESTGDSTDQLTAAQVAAVLGLPAGVDIFNYNQYADDATAADAIAVELVAQKIILSTLSLTAAVQGAASTDTATFPVALARKAALDGMVKTLVELNKVREGGSSNLVPSTLNLADFSDPLVLAEVSEFIAADARTGILSTAIAEAGLVMDAVVVDYALEKSIATIAVIADAFDDLDATELLGVNMSAVSALKHTAAEQIFNTAAAALDSKTSGADLSGFDTSAYLTLNEATGVATGLDTASQLAEQYLLDQLDLIDTDEDGKPNTCNATCLSFGFLEDADDDGDAVVDSADDFPLDSTETIDTDSDGQGNNADTDDDGDSIVDAADDFPLDSTETIDTDSDGVGDNADTDDDNDGVADSLDAFPLDPTESEDSDGDSTGDNADAINTSGAFELRGTTVILQDYNPTTQTTVSNLFDVTIANGVVSADLSSASLNLTNIRNGIASPAGDYSDALLRFDLDSALPVGDGNGTVDLYVTTGNDGSRAEGESQLHCQLQITWSSDGATASIIEPAQSIRLEVIRSSLSITTTIGAFDIMAVSVNPTTGVKTLDIKLLSALSEGVKVAGGVLDSLLVPRSLHIKVVTSLVINDANGVAVTQFDSLISLDN